MHEDYLGQKLCIFISKNDKYEGIVLYELLLEIAFNSRLSGGTATIGNKGFFGAQDESTKLKILRSSENLPVVLEFQGRESRISRYIERVQPMIKDGLLTRTDVRITKFNSTDEDAADIEDQKNEDQSQIFKEDVEVRDIPDLQAESQDQTIEEVVVDTPEPHIKTPSLDDVHTSEPTVADSGKSPEDEVKEDPDPHAERDSIDEGEEDEKETPDFDFIDDDQIDGGAEDDVLETESDSIIDEEDDEDSPVLQLTDLSETQTEDSSENNLEMDDTDKTPGDTSNKTEFAESQTEDDIDKLFDETNEKFESSFDDMLKQAGNADVGETDIDTEDENSIGKKPNDPSNDGNGDSDSAKASSETYDYDKDHIEEDMLNYFSSLFKK